MVCKTHKYADGGKVVKDHTMPLPEKGGKPKKIVGKGPPGGPHTPGAKGTYPKKKTARKRGKK